MERCHSCVSSTSKSFFQLEYSACPYRFVERSRPLSLDGANTAAACVMPGRALEVLCRDILEPETGETETPSEKPKKKLILGNSIKQLHDEKVIDDCLYDWSQQLHAFRKFAADPQDISISREDATDLQTVVNAIVEYIYELAERYDEFKACLEKRVIREKL